MHVNFRLINHKISDDYNLKNNVVFNNHDLCAPGCVNCTRV